MFSCFCIGSKSAFKSESNQELQIPEEIIFKILSENEYSIQDMQSFQAVNRQWNRIIRDPTIRDKYLKKIPCPITNTESWVKTCLKWSGKISYAILVDCSLSMLSRMEGEAFLSDTRFKIAAKMVFRMAQAMFASKNEVDVYLLAERFKKKKITSIYSLLRFFLKNASISGNTRLAPVLERVLQKARRKKKYTRIFILTDGMVSDVQRVNEVIQTHFARSREIRFALELIQISSKNRPYYLVSGHHPASCTCFHSFFDEATFVCNSLS